MSVGQREKAEQVVSNIAKRNGKPLKGRTREAILNVIRSPGAEVRKKSFYYDKQTICHSVREEKGYKISIFRSDLLLNGR